MNRCFFKVHKGTVKCDYFVALLFGCGSLMWPFVELGLRSEDGGLKTIINKDVLTISAPFSIESSWQSSMKFAAPGYGCVQEGVLFFFNFV